MKEGDAVRAVLYLFLSHIDRNLETFSEKSLDFYHFLKLYMSVSFCVRGFKLTLDAYKTEESLTKIVLSFYALNGDIPLVEYSTLCENENAPHLIFNELVEGFQEKLCVRWHGEALSGEKEEKK